MGVWNDCYGNEKRKLMKTSSSIAELSDLRPQAQSDSTAALSCTQSGDRPCCMAALLPPPAALPLLLPSLAVPVLLCPAQGDSFSVCSAGSAISPPLIFFYSN